MTEEIRNMFNQVIDSENNGNVVAELEILREYFTNPEFKKNLEEFTWKINNQSENSF